MRDHTNRRGFLGRMLTAAGAVSLPFAAARPLAAEGAVRQGPDAWLNEVRGTHRCLFDFNAHKKGVGLDHMNAFVSTYQSAYNTGPTAVGVVGTFYGIGPNASIIMGFDDFVWQKYQIGAYAELSDASGRPYTRNVFNSPTEADGHLLAQAMGIPMIEGLGAALVECSVASLQARGAKFLMCANALAGWTYELAARGKGAQPAIMDELRAHLLPGVTIVPAMVIAIEKAQEAGIRYNKQ
jgi:intracellular sulfur oxidation DsrE/DsrF family protein